MKTPMILKIPWYVRKKCNKKALNFTSIKYLTNYLVKTGLKQKSKGVFNALNTLKCLTIL